MLLLSVGWATHAQSYRIDWFTLDGGSGTSTAGIYNISGTIGQPDAGARMSGGDFMFDGGFWSLLAAVSTPGAPALTVARTHTNSVIISWPSPSAGWALQQNPDLNTTNWMNVQTVPNNDGAAKSIIVSPPVGRMCYRLRK